MIIIIIINFISSSSASQIKKFNGLHVAPGRSLPMPDLIWASMLSQKKLEHEHFHAMDN